MNLHNILKGENINTQFVNSCNGNRTKRERRCVTSATYDKVPISVFYQFNVPNVHTVLYSVLL